MDLGNGWWLGHIQSKYIIWNKEKIKEFPAKNIQEAIRKAKEIIKDLDRVEVL